MNSEKIKPEKTDEELVKLTLKDREVFGELINQYQEKLFRYIRRISGISPEDAEDVLQEVFIKAYQNLNDFDASLKFSSWIYRITHNQAIDHFRKSKLRPTAADLDGEVNEAMLAQLIGGLDPVKELDNKILAGQIKKAFSSMDEKYREVLILKFLEGKDYKEISNIIKKPMGSVATLINRAKKQFQKEYGKL